MVVVVGDFDSFFTSGKREQVGKELRKLAVGSKMEESVPGRRTTYSKNRVSIKAKETRTV